MIFISTGGYRNQSAIDVAIDFYSNNIRYVELSGGAYSGSFAADLMHVPDDLTLQIHNYFPPPATPFVFNLASSVVDISKLSVDLARNAIKIASGLKRPVYSFHAGFRINPRPRELGGDLITRELAPRALALKIFTERVLMLAEEAALQGVVLMIENNVIAKPNFNRFGEDPLLLTHPEEIEKFMKLMPRNVGLLLDVAHLKVSSNTLGFNLSEAHERLKPWIGGYHLSDNDGSVDSNGPVTTDSWFWESIKLKLDFYTLEVYGVPPSGLYSQCNLTSKMLALK